MGLVVHVQRGWQLRLSGHSPLEQWAAPSFFLFPIFSDRITGRWTAVYLSCSAACLYYRFVFDGFSNGREKIIRRWDDERFFFSFLFWIHIKTKWRESGGGGFHWPDRLDCGFSPLYPPSLIIIPTRHNSIVRCGFDCCCVDDGGNDDLKGCTHTHTHTHS